MPRSSETGDLLTSSPLGLSGPLHSTVRSIVVRSVDALIWVSLAMITVVAKLACLPD